MGYSFPILSFEQANPQLAATKMIGANKEQQIRNQYLGPTLAESLKQAQLNNQILAPKAEHAEDFAQAELRENLAKALLEEQQGQWYGPEAQARIALQGAQTNESNSLLPYKIKEAELYAKYPLLKLTGTAQQVGALEYENDKNPNLFAPAQQQMASGNPQDLIITPDKYNQLSAAVDAINKGKISQQPSPQLANALSPNIRSLFGKQTQESQQQQQLPITQQNPMFQQYDNMQQQQQPQSLTDILKQSIFGNLNEQKAKTEWYAKRAQAINYISAPADVKSSLVAQAMGMGYDPMESTDLFMKGKTINDLAAAKGLDPDNLPEPIYAPTGAVRTQMQKRSQAVNELNSLNKFVIDAVAPYSQTVFGYSPNQIVDAFKTNFSGTAKQLDSVDKKSLSNQIKSLPEEQQQKFIAAMALMPEISGIRFRALAGNQLGVESMKHIQDASMMHVNSLRSLVTPEVWKGAQEEVDNQITSAVNAANKVSYIAPSKDSQGRQSSGREETLTIKDPNGETHVIRKDKLDEALRRVPGITVVE